MLKETPDTAHDLIGDPLPKPASAEQLNIEKGRIGTVNEHERPHRDFLTQGETTTLLNSAKTGRFGVRDYAMLLLAFRHGLRVSELVSVRTSDIDLNTGASGLSGCKMG
jgi:type 1 fimbriae regulatory protein FimB